MTIIVSIGVLPPAVHIERPSLSSLLPPFWYSDDLISPALTKRSHMAELPTTKLSIPLPSSNLESRPRLADYLNAGLDRKLPLLTPFADTFFEMVTNRI